MLILASAVISSVLVFQVHSKGSATRPVAATVTIMRERLDAAHVHAAVMPFANDRVRVTFDSAPADFVSRLLTQTGNITCKIFPNGTVYRSPASRPFRDAEATLDAGGQSIVAMRVADPRSFYRFTSANVNKDIGFYLDGVLLTHPQIYAPISQYTEIAGLSQARAREIAAIIDSGTLPVRVTLVR